MDELQGSLYEPTFSPQKKQLPVTPNPRIEVVESEGLNIFWGILIGIVIVGAVIMAGMTVYYVSEGKFQTTVDQDVILEPNITVISNTSNAFSYNPQTDNQFENTFNNYFNVTVEAC